MIIKIFEEFKVKRYKRISNQSSRGGVRDVMYAMHHNKEKAFDLLQDTLDKVRKRFKIGNKAKYINAGAFGMAFEVSNNRVIKLTSSEDEAGIVIKNIGKKVPNCVNYYDIVYIKKYEIYAILMDMAELPDGKCKNVFEELMNIFNSGRKISTSEKNLKRILKRLGRSDVSDKYLIEIINDFNEMIKSLKKHNIPTNDLHSDNFGYLNGKMVHFDMLGYTTNKDVKKISKI